jgi:hypothetical protein
VKEGKIMGRKSREKRERRNPVQLTEIEKICNDCGFEVTDIAAGDEAVEKFRQIIARAREEQTVEEKK